MCKESKQLNKCKAKRIQLPIHENQSNHHTVTIRVYFIRKFADDWEWGKFLCHIRNNTTKLSIDNETHPTIIHAMLLYHQDIHDRTLAGHANSVW